MSDTGWLTAGSAANVNTGDEAWSNPTNALSSNNIYASVAFDTFSDSTDSLALYNFTTGLPDGATVTGIEVSLEGKLGDAEFSAEWSAKLVKEATNVSSVASDEKTSATPSTTETTVTFGSSTDVWGTGGWSLADFRSSTFGVWIQLDVGGVDNAYVDCVLLKIHYQEASGARVQFIGS